MHRFVSHSPNHRALAADCLYFRLPALAHLASASFALVVPEGAKAPSWCASEWVAQSVDAAVAVADARLEAGDVARAYVFLAGGCHRGSIMSTVPGLCVVGLGATAVEVEVVAAASPALMCLHPPRCDAGAEPDAGVEVDGVTLAACATHRTSLRMGPLLEKMKDTSSAGEGGEEGEDAEGGEGGEETEAADGEDVEADGQEAEPEEVTEDQDTAAAADATDQNRHLHVDSP